MIFDVGRSFPVHRSTLIVLINTLLLFQLLSHSTNRASSFIVPSPFVVHRLDDSRTSSFYRSSVTTLHASSKGGGSSPTPLPDTDDPYLLLGLSTPTADKKQIKRAYKRQALRYHPDVRIGPDSTQAEKKAANDDFTRINAAYEVLSGKGGGGGGKSPSSSSASGRASSTGTTGRGGYSYDPPHRRSGAPPPPPRDSYSTSWEDFMPQYDDEAYDTDGDSFGAIFSDFLKGAASSASSASKGGGILEDLVSFLEGNFGSSFGAGGESDDGDAEFANLLTYGTFDEVKNELDDADLLAKQLERKDETLAAELEDIRNRGEGGGSSRYLERMEMDERKMEIEARRKVVKSYLAKANTRRVRLRERYVELRSQRSAGRSSSNVGGASSSYSSYNTGSTSSSSSYSTSSTSSSSNSSSSSDEGKRPESKSDDDSWKKEGFGSSGRSRRGRRAGGTGPSSYSSAGSSSSGASSRRTEPSPSSSSSNSTGRSTTTGSRGVNTNTRTTTGRSSASSSSSSSSSRTNAGGSSSNKVPPHRRLTTDYISPEQEKRRLREIKVDEAIDQMKKELGL